MTLPLPAPRPLLALTTAVLLGLTVASTALAQYKVVGPDGKVTYTDQPRPGATATRPADAAPTAATPALPAELRQAAGRYPVTLYAASRDCRPCDSGRQLLVQRGIPFTEKRVDSQADVAALQRLSGGLNLPLLTIGSQQLRGLVVNDWQSYLDAAGYPRESRLPANWRAAAATPLAPPVSSEVVDPNAIDPNAVSAPTPRAPARDPAQPNIRF